MDLNKRPDDMVRITTPELAQAFIEEQVAACREQIGVAPAPRALERRPMDLNKRPDDMVRITTPELAQAFIEEQVAACREQIGDKKALLALSGGVDSSVVAALLIKAIGKQLICVHVNHGLMRKGESEQVVDVFRNQLDANLVYVDATDRFLELLDGVAEPEAKRKIIGAEFSSSACT